MTDSYLQQDIDGLAMAYSSNAPVLYKGSLYIPGTRTIGDVLDDLLIFSPVFGLSNAVVSTEMRLFKNNRPERLVGHSLGAAVAAYLGRKWNIYNVGFGSPVYNSENFADVVDPVGLFVKSKYLRNASFLHHADVREYKLF